MFVESMWKRFVGSALTLEKTNNRVSWHLMLQGAIEQLSAELYQKDIRFVPELIQATTLVPIAFFVATMPCELSLHLSFDFSQFACSAWIERSHRRPILDIQYEI
jgi:hypothetical protein